MNIQTALQTLLEGKDLSAENMDAAMRAIMTGQASPAQIGAFLVALRMKGETVAEIAAAARVMRSLAVPVKVTSDYLVDTCGTGGDGAKTFNISTVSALVAAAAGAHVAKHGNRAVSGNSGSADVLKEAGVNLELTPDQVARCIEHVGVGFLFAPLHHSAMKHAIGPRRELGVRTVFNLLGPLTNPAGAPNQVMGVFSRDWVRPMAEVLQALGSRHVMVVHAQDGLDEISHASETYVAELKAGQINTYEINPEDYGIKRGHLGDICVDSVQQSLEMINQVLKNQPGPALDIVMLNAGAAIYVSGVAKSFQAGIDMAEDAITTGLAREKLSELVQFSSISR